MNRSNPRKSSPRFQQPYLRRRVSREAVERELGTLRVEGGQFFRLTVAARSEFISGRSFL